MGLIKIPSNMMEANIKLEILLNLINKLKYNKLNNNIIILKIIFLFLLIIGLFSVSAGANIKKLIKQITQTIKIVLVLKLILVIR